MGRNASGVSAQLRWVGSGSPNTRKGPVAEERLALDPVDLDRAEDPTVRTVGAVVTHHEHVIGGNLDRAERSGHDTGVEVRLVQGHTIDEHLILGGLDHLTGQADDTLDQVVVGRCQVVGSEEDDDVPSLDVAELVAELVDEYSIPDLERRLHRRGRDRERLE